MLFDLRGRGRRRTVQAIYLTLAILMGGGLVLFGIGGATSGGLVDAIGGGGGGGTSNDEVFQQRVDTARKRVQTTPAEAAAWAALARAEYQLAGIGDNFDQNQDSFTAAGRTQLRAADRAWQRYLSLDPKKVDGDVASLMVQAYIGNGSLSDPAKAASAQEYVIDARPASNNLYGTLAVYAAAAGQTRKSELALQKALELTPKADREAYKQQIEQAKQQLMGASTDQATAATSG
jgi:hypothetical protein